MADLSKIPTEQLELELLLRKKKITLSEARQAVVDVFRYELQEYGICGHADKECLLTKTIDGILKCLDEDRKPSEVFGEE